MIDGKEYFCSNSCSITILYFNSLRNAVTDDNMTSNGQTREDHRIYIAAVPWAPRSLPRSERLWCIPPHCRASISWHWRQQVCTRHSVHMRSTCRSRDTAVRRSTAVLCFRNTTYSTNNCPTCIVASLLCFLQSPVKPVVATPHSEGLAVECLREQYDFIRTMMTIWQIRTGTTRQAEKSL